jgi:hypothetical protein
MSAAVVRAVAECPGRTFNHLEDGGYLMWSLPGRPVFVDSRMEAYPLSHLRRSRSADLEGEYRALFLEHDIACAVVATDSRLFARLRQDGAVPALVDGNRAVFRDLP